MINFFKVFFIVLIEQIIFVITFAFTNNRVDFLSFSSVLLLFLYLGMYFKNNEIYELKISNKLFKLFFIPSWIVVGVLITPIAFWLENNGILPNSSGDPWIGFSNYIFLPMLIILFLIALAILELIIFIVKKISKKIK